MGPNRFEDELQTQISEIRGASLWRELRRIDSPQAPWIQSRGRALLNFSSNDYLGLANSPVLKTAMAAAVERYGAGAGASRLVCGSLAPHHDLEDVLANFKGTPAALTFSSGYTAALGAVGALIRSGDLLVIDRHVHACFIDAARLCRARLRVFPHNDLDRLESILKREAKSRAPASAPSRTWIVTESVFSMDGGLAPLRDLVDLKDRHGARLIVDEAHATGLFGENRRGLSEEFGVADRVEVQMGTLSKALGSAGGFICGSRALIDVLINRARTFMFSTAPPPAAAAAAQAAVELIQSNEGDRLRRRLWARVDELKNGLVTLGLARGAVRSPILPLITGAEPRALDLAARLGSRGFYVPAIRFPAVGRGQARLRLTVSAAHEPEDVSALITALTETESAGTSPVHEPGQIPPADSKQSRG